MNRLAVSVVIFLSVSGMMGMASALPQIQITTGKPVYHYGESLSLSITVSNVTGDMAVLQITDQSNQSSSPINLMISKPVSSITAPVPFYRTTFAPGSYLVQIQYDGASASTAFKLVDSGEVAIPPQFKTVASSWVHNQTSGRLFGEHIAELVSSGVITVNDFQEQNQVVIPEWFKNDANWWSNGDISDNDFGHVVEYLIESKIMKV
ncbi:MAG TPA: hypothetical protein VJ792_06530 [Candidatus Nitrosotalea sp.]|nr:hypothetical protein [Candidatus Nitrosotalea sp.]